MRPFTPIVLMIVLGVASVTIYMNIKETQKGYSPFDKYLEKDKT